MAVFHFPRHFYMRLCYASVFHCFCLSYRMCLCSLHRMMVMLMTIMLGIQDNGFSPKIFQNLYECNSFAQFLKQTCVNCRCSVGWLVFFPFVVFFLFSFCLNSSSSHFVWVLFIPGKIVFHFFFGVFHSIWKLCMEMVNCKRTKPLRIW